MIASFIFFVYGLKRCSERNSPIFSNWLIPLHPFTCRVHAERAHISAVSDWPAMNQAVLHHKAGGEETVLICRVFTSQGEYRKSPPVRRGEDGARIQRQLDTQFGATARLQVPSQHGPLFIPVAGVTTQRAPGVPRPFQLEWRL